MTTLMNRGALTQQPCNCGHRAVARIQAVQAERDAWRMEAEALSTRLQVVRS